MPSKGVTDRQRVAKALVAAARTHAQQVGQRLQAILTPMMEEGEVYPDQTFFQELVARYLQHRVVGIITADEAHIKEQHDDLAPRRRRDETAATLNRTLVQIREALVGAYGRDLIPEIAGLVGSTATEPVVLLRQAGRVLERLREPIASLATPRLEGVQVDPARLADQLQPAMDDLAEALQDVDREQRETETTLREKDLALDAFDAAVGGIGRILIGFDQLGGFSEFAEKIRLTLPARRRNGTGQGEPLPLPDSPLPDDPPPEEEPPPDGEPEAEIGVPRPAARVEAA